MQVCVGDLAAGLVRYRGSFFAIRAEVEPLVAVDRPEPLLIYVPGVERDGKSSVLMELEKAGDCYAPQLKQLARNVLRPRYTDGVIDEMLAPERLEYSDVVALLDQGTGGETASLLRVIFDPARGECRDLAAWLASGERSGRSRTRRQRASSSS